VTAQVIHRDRLGALTKIGQGGQGVVYRAPNVNTKFAASMVFKEYKSQTLADIDFTALAAMPALVEDSLSYAEAEWLISVAAWPCALVEDDGGPTGFVMPAIPEEFFIPLTTVKGASNATAEFQHLLNHSSILGARGIDIDDAQRYALLREVASALAFLHKHGACVGDISPKNLLFSLRPHPAVYFIDCDAMRINGVSALPQLETPGWEVPSGEELATVYSDTYKLGLLALRLATGDHDVKNPRHLPSTAPNLLRQIITDTINNAPQQRPLPEAWTYVLGQAVEEAQHRRRLTAARAPDSGSPAPPEIPIVHSRPPIGSSASPVRQSRPAGRPPPSRRALSGVQRALLWAAGVLGTLAIVISMLIVLHAHDEQPQQQRTLPTVSQPVATPPPPTSAPTAPGQVTYSVTGTTAPFDQITVTYTDASGMRRILNNVYIPWTITLTPISPSDVGSIEASSLLRLSKLNCSITSSDGTVLSSNNKDQPQANC
jgi:eukaryotic-like serine/threonine-protein kinase